MRATRKPFEEVLKEVLEKRRTHKVSAFLGVVEDLGEGRILYLGECSEDVSKQGYED